MPGRLLEGPPRFELRKGMVHCIDEYGDRVLSLGDFVITAKLAMRLAREWTAQANQPTRIGALKTVKIAERGHR